MAEKVLRHFHLYWWDRKADPEPHILCLTAENKAAAVRHADAYLGERLGSIENVVDKGDRVSWNGCIITNNEP